MLVPTKVGVFMKTVDLASPLIPSTRWAARLALGVVAGAAVLAISACGGGTQAEKFAPTTFVALGDENSSLKEMTISSGVLAGQTIKGMKYTVNAVLPYKGFDWPLTDAGTGLNRYSVNPPFLAGETMVWDDTTNYPVGGTTMAPKIGPGLNRGTNTLVYAVERSFTALAFKYIQPSAPTVQVPTTRDVSIQYQFSCQEHRLWTQILANSYRLGFADDCPAEKLSGAYSYAVAGATVADVVAQFHAHPEKFGSSTLVSVWAGQNDILAAYDAGVSASDTVKGQKIAEMLAKGRTLGQTIDAIAATGARVVFLTAPALQYSPHVRAPGATGTPAMAFMASLVNEFNNGLTGSQGVRSDGHKVAIVRADEETAAMGVTPANYALANSDTAWCIERRDVDGNAVANVGADVNYPLLCNNMTGKLVGTTTVVSDSYTYMWATDTLVGPAVHAAIGGLAYTRASGSPL
jgi:hypothetical protein